MKKICIYKVIQKSKINEEKCPHCNKLLKPVKYQTTTYCIVNDENGNRLHTFPSYRYKTWIECIKYLKTKRYVGDYEFIINLKPGKDILVNQVDSLYEQYYGTLSNL